VERNKLGVRLAGHLLNNKHPKPEDLQRAFPVHPIDWRGLADTSATHPDSIQLVWIGHASMLVRMGGATFLTDPVLSKRYGSDALPANAMVYETKRCCILCRLSPI
jgi:hypothetical protein